MLKSVLSSQLSSPIKIARVGAGGGGGSGSKGVGCAGKACSGQC